MINDYTTAWAIALGITVLIAAIVCWPRTKKQKANDLRHQIDISPPPSKWHAANLRRVGKRPELAMPYGKKPESDSRYGATPDADFDVTGFALGMATGVPISPSRGISSGSLLGAAMHSSPQEAAAVQQGVAGSPPATVTQESSHDSGSSYDSSPSSSDSSSSSFDSGSAAP